MVEPSATLDLNLNSDVILDAFSISFNSTPCCGVSSNVTCCGCFQGVQSSSTLCWMWQRRRQKAAIAFRVSNCVISSIVELPQVEVTFDINVNGTLDESAPG